MPTPPLRFAEVSERTGIPVATLRFMRYQGRGPQSFKLGGRLVFKPEDVEGWIEEQYRAALEIADGR